MCTSQQLRQQDPGETTTRARLVDPLRHEHKPCLLVLQTQSALIPKDVELPGIAREPSKCLDSGGSACGNTVVYSLTDLGILQADRQIVSQAYMR